MTTINDVLVCPECKSEDTYSNEVERIDFGVENDTKEGRGMCIAKCGCNACKKTFKLSFCFNYDIIESNVDYEKDAVVDTEATTEDAE